MRKGLLITIAAGLSLTLAACSGGTSGSPSESGKSSAPAAGGKLTIWTDEKRVDAFKKIGEEFKKSNGITLDVVQKPTDDVKKDFIAQAPTGEGPDLVVGANDWTGDLVANGVVAPVELGDTGGFDKNAIKAFTHDGQLYGVPYALENIGLVRNNAMLKDTPKTFDELIAQGKKASGAQFPVIIQTGAAGDAYHLYPLQTSFGGSVLKTGSDGEYTNELGMGGSEGEAFAAYVKKLAGEKVLSTSVGGDQAKQAFLDKKTPYIITGPWWAQEFKKGGMDVSVLPIPSAGGKPSAPFIGVQGVYVSSKSKNALAANQFVTYLASVEAQDALYELGGRMPALTESAGKVSDEILKGFSEAGAQGHPMPGVQAMSSVWTDWGQAEADIIDGKAEPAARWKQMVSTIEKKIAG